jgi:hypothetical protein
MRCNRSNLYALTPKFPSIVRSRLMMDVILVVGGTVLFFAAIAYTYACERL